MSKMGEFDLIGRISGMFSVPQGVTGIGDDCAVIPQKDGKDTLISTDMLIEGSHFLIDDIPPYRLGWKSAAVNISDIAAMGGKPTATFLSFALPKTLGSDWLDEFMRGYKDISDKYGVPLLGGDTTSSQDRLCINVTVMGEIEHGRSALRSSAKPGDRIYVTGPLGDSSTGLKVVLEGVERGEDEKVLVDRHYLPCLRVEEGQALAATSGVHAMMDISDGIGSDLRHILKASGVGARVNVADIPLSRQMRLVCERNGWDAAEIGISGGEDYELLFTAAPGTLIPVPCFCIGTITADPLLEWIGGSKDYLGFRHF